MGIDVLTIPSGLRGNGLAHWETLLSSRAIENLSMCGVCSMGKHYGSRRTYGHTMIINAWGKL
ncbi:MAG: hypothetical protein Ct9H300mP6_05020 [Gammaproteobacteria bacterium]|nr:MAG: hypothetical protein Ct9H300mP6_05020 [Gammaproteobacteria bacterium]